MVRTRFLSLEQKDEWYCLLAKAGAADIYYYPEYLELYGQEGEPLLFAVETERSCLVYPFLKRSLTNLDFLNDCPELRGYMDLTSPYGYGGPCTSAEGEEQEILLKTFREQFERYCSENGVVSQFVRFHPLLNNHTYGRELVDVFFNRPTVTVDLEGGREGIWKRLTSTNRNRIRKAEKAELLFREGNAELDWEHFFQLYYLTMKTKQANQYYFFSSDYFRKLRAGLKDKVRLFLVEKEGVAIAAAIFLSSEHFFHYHLGGSNPEKLEFAPNNILFFETACRASDQGCLKLHLGGGYKSGFDELYRFKKGFNRESSSSFYIGKRINDPAVYDFLVSKRLEFRKDFHQPDFFPLYRG